MFNRNGIIRSQRQGGNSGRGLSEREKFEVSMNEALQCTKNLDLEWREAPFLRCSGILRRSQKLVAVSTFRCRKKTDNGVVSTTDILPVVIEEE